MNFIRKTELLIGSFLICSLICSIEVESIGCTYYPFYPSLTQVAYATNCDYCVPSGTTYTQACKFYSTTSTFAYVNIGSVESSASTLISWWIWVCVAIGIIIPLIIIGSIVACCCCGCCGVAALNKRRRGVPVSSGLVISNPAVIATTSYPYGQSGVYPAGYSAQGGVYPPGGAYPSQGGTYPSQGSFPSQDNNSYPPPYNTNATIQMSDENNAPMPVLPDSALKS